VVKELHSYPCRNRSTPLVEGDEAYMNWLGQRRINYSLVDSRKYLASIFNTLSLLQHPEHRSRTLCPFEDQAAL